MGLHAYVYIGAYLEIYADPVTRPGPWECPNGHMQAWREKFCGRCGAKLVQTPKEYPARLWDLLPDEMEDELTSYDDSHEPPPILAIPTGRL